MDQASDLADPLCSEATFSMSLAIRGKLQILLE